MCVAVVRRCGPLPTRRSVTASTTAHRPDDGQHMADEEADQTQHCPYMCNCRPAGTKPRARTPSSRAHPGETVGGGGGGRQEREEGAKARWSRSSGDALFGPSSAAVPTAVESGRKVAASLWCHSFAPLVGGLPACARTPESPSSQQSSRWGSIADGQRRLKTTICRRGRRVPHCLLFPLPREPGDKDSASSMVTVAMTVCCRRRVDEPTISTDSAPPPADPCHSTLIVAHLPNPQILDK